MNSKVLHKLMANSEWQYKVEAFVKREVLYCVSSLVNELAKDEKYIDDLSSICLQDDFETPAREHGWTPKQSPYIEVSDYCWKHDLDPQVNEAYEHWIVSDWLADKLAAEGEMVIKDFLDLTIWGRTTTGQSISIDYVINKIYLSLMREDMKTNELIKAITK